MQRARLGVVVVLTLVLLVPASAVAAGRVALVVGNSAYSAIGRLPNPGNDAADMSGALRRLGFEVTTVLDVDRVELTEALRTFTRASAGADVSLVFYAGHGLEVDGANYLVPVDARLERDTDVRFETVELDYVLAATTGAALRVVILDACRNNPLARSMQRTGASRSVSRGSFGNLDESLLGDETLVAYAAAAGTTAADGTGRNSPYTSALLSYLEQPLEIGLLFREVSGASAGGDGWRATAARVCVAVGRALSARGDGSGPACGGGVAGPGPRGTSPDPGGSDAGRLLSGAGGRGVRTGDARGAPGLADVAGGDGDGVPGCCRGRGAGGAGAGGGPARRGTPGEHGVGAGARGGLDAGRDGLLGVDAGEHARVGLRGVSGAVAERDLRAAGDEPVGDAARGREHPARGGSDSIAGGGRGVSGTARRARRWWWFPGASS